MPRYLTDFGTVVDVPEKDAKPGWTPTNEAPTLARTARDVEAEQHPLQAAVEAFGREGLNALGAPARALGAGLQATGITQTNPMATWSGDALQSSVLEDSLRTQFAKWGLPTEGPDFDRRLHELKADLDARAQSSTGKLAGFAGTMVGGLPLAEAGGALQGATTGALGGGLGARIAGGAVGGATVGAPAALAEASDQAYREGRALTGEQAAAAAMHGLLGGAGVGAGLTGLGELVGSVVGRARSRILDTTGEEVTAESAQTVKKEPGALAKLMGMASGKDPETIQEMIGHNPASQEARRLAVFEGDSTREAAERQLRGHVNQIEEATRNLTPEWRELKTDNIARTVVRDSTMPEIIPGVRSMADVDVAGQKFSIDKRLPLIDKDRLTSIESGKTAGANIPPIEIVSYPGQDPFVKDGTHRLTAAVRAGESDIPATFKTYDESGNLVGQKTTRVPLQSAPDQGGVFAQQQELATEWLANAREKIDEMKAQADVYTDRGAVKRLSNAFSRAEREVGDAVEGGDGGAMFKALDDLKKRIGDKSVTRAGQMLSTGGGSDTAQAARAMYDDLKGVLEHDAWGEAGQMQKQVNQAYTDWMGTKRLFDQRFMTETGREGWERTFGADPGKIASFVRGLSDPAKDLDHSIIEQHLASTEQLAQALTGAGGLTEAKAAELESIQNAVKGFSDSLGTAGKAISAVNKLDQLKGGAQHGIGAGALLGHLMGGPLGGAAGGLVSAGFNMMRNPALMVERLALAERLAGATASSGQSALDGLFEGIGSAVNRARGPIDEFGRLSSLELFQAHHETPAMAYQERVQDLATAQATLPDRLSRVLGPQGAQDPALALAAYASANRAIQYLQSKMPSGIIDPQSLTPQTSRIQPSREEIMGFADLWAAVMRPRDVIAGIPEGRMSPNQMDAVRNVYPRVYGWLRNGAMEKVDDADQKGHEIPLKQRDILESLFDLGAGAGRSYSVDFAAKWGPQMGDGAAQRKNKAQPQQGPPRLGRQRMGTLSTSMIGE